MKEWSIQVDCVVVTAPSLVQVDHAVVTEIPHHAPHCSLRQVKVAGDLLDRGIWTNGDVKENAPLGRQERPIPALTVTVGSPSARFPLLLRW
jgi:hypothetical protein